MQKEENYTLYSIKMIAAIAVVFIHCMFPGVLGLVVKNVARFAVPIFFIISGLFWNNPTLNRWEMVNVGKRRRKKVIHMAVYAFLVYIVAIFIINCVQGHLVDFFIPFLSIKNWIVFLLGNYPNPFLGIGHLWYLMAIIYVYNVVIFVEKRNCWLISYKISCCLIITIFIFEIVNVFTNVSIPVFIYRNWLVTGFPLFTLGRYLNDNKDELRKVSYTFLIVLYFVFFNC